MKPGLSFFLMTKGSGTGCGLEFGNIFRKNNIQESDTWYFSVITKVEALIFPILS